MLISNLIAKTLALLGALIFALTPIGFEGRAQLDADRQAQQLRLVQLREDYRSGSYTPVDERVFFEGDLEAALQNGMKLNELQMIATHNSYQTPSVPSFQKLCDAVNRVTGGRILYGLGYYNAQTLTAQLNGGVRSLELDVEVQQTKDGIAFTCQHSPNIDMTTTCYSLELALEEIRLWSENNPGHLPLTLLIEPKIWMLPSFEMDLFTPPHMQELDDLLRRALGNSLYTPNDMLRQYESFRQMRLADDWPAVQSLRGKVLVLLHEGPATPLYLARDKTLHSLAMFPMVHPNAKRKAYAAFVLENDPKKVAKNADALFRQENLIVRTRADSFGNPDEATRQAATQCGAQMLSSDYPPLPESKDLPVFSFPGGKTLRRIK